MGNGAKAKAPDEDRLEEVVMVRMSSALKARIEKHRQKVRKDTGIPIGFATAARVLIEKGLEAS